MRRHHGRPRQNSVVGERNAQLVCAGVPAAARRHRAEGVLRHHRRLRRAEVPDDEVLVEAGCRDVAACVQGALVSIIVTKSPAPLHHRRRTQDADQWGDHGSIVCVQVSDGRAIRH